VGDFRAVEIGGKVNKNGGNVASHFLTHDGRLIHSVTGPVSARVLLQEAEWAIDMFAEAKSKPYAARTQFVSSAHQQASWSPESGQDRKVHELLSMRPLPKLQIVYKEIFEKILGQKVSHAGPRLAQASQRLEYAKKTGRPILFVMHHKGGFSNPQFSATTRLLLREYVVIAMPLREAPALSQLTGQPPFEANSSARPLFVVARSDCKQLNSIAGWDESRLAAGLADGWVDALDRNPPGIGTLVRAQRLLRKVNPSSADKARELTIRVKEEGRAAREAAKEAAKADGMKLAAR
jgi:hypothetical protein